MEASINSSMNKPMSSNEGSDESGWTIYFEDFLASGKREASCDYSSNSTVGVGSSMISDAASCVAWKSPAIAEPSEGYKKLSFKKRKAMGVLEYDDPLEDTASSPVNSPKVSNMNHLDLNTRMKDENRHISQEKAVGGENCTELMRDEIDELSFIEREKECTELKKKGLCLVPLSMLVDYLG